MLQKKTLQLIDIHISSFLHILPFYFLSRWNAENVADKNHQVSGTAINNRHRVAQIL